MNHSDSVSAADHAAAENLQLSALRGRFAPVGAFLAPLLRHAYRSGATHVDIDWRNEPALLTIEYTGRGIEALEKLLRIGAKSWKLTTILHQHDFGLAFVALLCACERLEIISGVNAVQIDTEEFFRGAGAECRTRPSFLAGVRLGLTLRAAHCPQALAIIEDDLPTRAQAWDRLLSSLTLGFHPQVTFNGRQMMQPAGGGLNSYKRIACGWINAAGNEGGDVLPQLYYEGLPIHNGQRQHSYMALHLDPHQFTLALPQQDELLEHERQLQRIAVEVAEFRRAELKSTRRLLSPRLFVDLHWRQCLTLNLPQLLRDMPLTAEMLYRWHAPVCASIHTSYYCDEWGSRPLPADTDVLVRELRARHLQANGRSHAPLASLFAMSLGLAILKDVVPDEHPARRRCIDLLDPQLRFVCEVEAPGKAVDFVSPRLRCQVLCCRAFTIRCEVAADCSWDAELCARVRALPSVRITDQTIHDFDGGRILHPQDSADASAGLQQAITYADGDDYRGDWFRRDRALLESQLRAA